MSLDLFPNSQRLREFPISVKPEASAWDNFIVGSGKTAMAAIVRGASGADLMRAVPEILTDAITGGTEAQDRFFAQHEETFRNAVDYWTPRPDEVGAAGQIVGELLGLLPVVIASPHAAVAGVTAGTAEELTKRGVTPGKSTTVGVIQGAGLATGVWMPFLGGSLPAKMVIGAGSNVGIGVGTRGLSGAVLQNTQAAGDFKAFDATALTLDALLGAAFGGVAHLKTRGEIKQARRKDAIKALKGDAELQQRVLEELGLSQDNAAEFFAQLDELKQERAEIVRAADEAIARRFERDRQAMLAAGIEPDEALREAFRRSYPETEKRLLSAAEIGALRISEMSLDDARQAIAEGRGLIFTGDHTEARDIAIEGRSWPVRKESRISSISDFNDELGAWAEVQPPSVKESIATLRQAEHMNVDSAPRVFSAEETNAHVNAMRKALNDVANDRPVEVGGVAPRFDVPRGDGISVPDLPADEVAAIDRMQKISEPQRSASLGEAGSDPLAAAAKQAILDNPDLMIALEDGTMKKASEIIKDAEAEAQLASEDSQFFETAARCLIGRGA